MEITSKFKLSTLKFSLETNFKRALVSNYLGSLNLTIWYGGVTHFQRCTNPLFVRKLQISVTQVLPITSAQNWLRIYLHNYRIKNKINPIYSKVLKTAISPPTISFNGNSPTSSHNNHIPLFPKPEPSPISLKCLRQPSHPQTSHSMGIPQPPPTTTTNLFFPSPKHHPSPL